MGGAKRWVEGEGRETGEGGGGECGGGGNERELYGSLSACVIFGHVVPSLFLWGSSRLVCSVRRWVRERPKWGIVFGSRFLRGAAIWGCSSSRASFDFYIILYELNCICIFIATYTHIYTYIAVYLMYCMRATIMYLRSCF